ncbi:MAG: 5'-methylthioadenosine/S-adenosylhomocysteine nucleosidase [Cyanothece sp. SIO1E1]|nr:5'-methylthioadenosine/S-adenosylhomocysteine nucleosidase [Cyanothece sp. SIO1E1]
MSGEFFQPGRSPLTRQSSGLPVALGDASDPKIPTADTLSNVQPGQAIPCVVILTALPEEFLAVKAHLSNVREEIHSESKTVYERGQFLSRQVTWDVAIVETGQGNSSAADETQRAIAYFNPDVVLFVGVAGGRKDVAIGDVVAGDKVYNYESGRDEDVFRPRPETGRASYPLEQRARAVVRAWIERRRESGGEKLPRAFVGAIAAGESVVGSIESTAAQLIHRNYGDALAVEKEGYGFLEAARRSRDLPAMVIRGISDLLDGKEEADAVGSQELAARHACEFAFEMLATLKGARQASVDAESQSEEVGLYRGGKLNLDLTWKPPASIAILRLEQDSDGYKLRAHHSQLSSLEESADSLTLAIELGQFGQFQPWTIDTIGKLEGYQPKHCLIGQVLRWLRYLHQHEPEFDCLVIAEPPTSIIPWELLNLEEQALGVALQTVRVSDTAHDDDSVRVRRLDAVGDSCQGSAMVYACGTVTDGDNLDYSLTFQSYCYKSVVCDQPEQVLRHLQQTKPEVGLVLMADDSLQQVAVDRRRFFLNRTRLFRRSRSLVMLQPMARDNSHRGLAIELLAHGAEGVLGMLEAVDRAIVQQVIDLFFEQYRQEAGVPVPELLRRAREAIAQRLDNELTDEVSRLYLATCMYAYYGHPMTVLQLTLAEGASHD